MRHSPNRRAGRPAHALRSSGRVAAAAVAVAVAVSALTAACGGGPAPASSPNGGAEPAVPAAPTDVTSSANGENTPGDGVATSGVDTSPPVSVETVETEPDPGATGDEIPGWVTDALAERDGDDIALIMGTSDHQIGTVRVSFLIVNNANELTLANRADVRYGTADSNEPRTGVAQLLTLNPRVRSRGADDLETIYVVRLEIADPGRYWLVVDPEGEATQAVGSIDVRQRSVSIPVGEKAPPSDNPTLDDAAAEEITTARPPDTELLRSSIADALAAEVPFVVAFATPAFCQTRTCGPTVEILDLVRRAYTGSVVRFIHVEVYEDNDPNKGPNQWLQEWKLPTEPWVFLVNRKGNVVAKFEGAVALDELVQAVRAYLI